MGCTDYNIIDKKKQKKNGHTKNKEQRSRIIGCSKNKK